MPLSLASLALAAVLARAGAPTPTGEVRATPLEGAAPRRPEHPRGTGLVVYATAGRAYLDVGAADGMPQGAVISLRGGPEVCTADLVAEHSASCPATRLRAGDAIAFHAAPERPPPKPLPPLLPEEDLVRRAAALQAAPPAPLIEHKAAPQLVAEPVRRARRLVASAGWAQWSSTDSAGLGAARVDIGIRDAEIGAGLVLDLEARGERWVPGANPRFRPAEDTRFYLWQAQLTAPLSWARLSAGRVLPYGIPGASIFDGATASTRVGWAEVGLFGGVVPEPDTLEPTADRSTGGVFWSLSRDFRGRFGIRQDGRIAVVHSPELGTRYEATLGGSAWWKAAHLSAEAQLGTGGTAQSSGPLDAARVDVSAHVLRSVSLGGGFRHTGLEWPAPYATLEPALFPGRSNAADGWASWDLWIFRLGATGGFSRDVGSGRDRSWFGPELGLPRLWRGQIAVTAGYLEERGWLEGRSAWLQASLRAGARFRFTTRGTWTHATPAVADADELGVLAAASAELGRGFGVRVSVLGRTAVSLTGEGGGSSPLGVTGAAAVYAAY
jgi:hypothetical protein